MSEASRRTRAKCWAALGVAGALVASTTGTSAAMADPGAPKAVAQKPANPTAVALAYVAAHRGDYGLTAEAVADLRVSDVVPLADIGSTTVYVQQQVHNIDVYNAVTSVTVGPDGTVSYVAARVAPESKAAAKGAPAPTLDAVAAVKAAAGALGLRPTEEVAVVRSATGDDRATLVSASGLSAAPIPVHLEYQPDEAGGMALAWDMSIDEPGGEHYWSIRVDAGTGAELDRSDWVDHESAPGVVADGSSYTVYGPPLEAPSFGGRTLINQPAINAASPFGWHDTDGAAGPEFTTTQGNNVRAYLDLANDNTDVPADYPIDGLAGLDFNPPIDLTMAPSVYRPAAVTNLFYWNNHVHDVMQAFGFDAASGNFQVNNYGLGGLGSDDVRAEAQDGGGVNNANFATPPDGSSPRMQMYVFDAPTPDRDGDLDNGVVVHEYGHGISNRLTGGPSNVNCLGNIEQMGEGWSDYYGLLLTMLNSAGGPATTRGIGTYVLNQATTGAGIRDQRYSPDNTINTMTYDTIKTAAIPHGVGTVWAEMLWEMTWRFINTTGFDANLASPANPNAGNIVSMHLVTDALKLQPCSPGFVDGRNAILAADQARYSGSHACAIWEEFAARGLGFSANQGSTASRTDGTQAFDLPPACIDLSLTKVAGPNPVSPGGQITYTLTASNNKVVAMPNVTITDPVPANATYVAGSASAGACNGVFAAGTVTFTIASIAAGASQACQFRVTAPVVGSTSVFADHFEPDASAWTVSHGAGTVDWALSTTTPHTPVNAMFATDPAVVSDQYLAMTNPVVVPAANGELRFWHSHAFEAPNFDGGVVEYSTNGTTWLDVGAANFTQNGYTGTISSCCSSPIAGRAAFTGNIGGAGTSYRESVVNLASLAGQSVRFRFRAASDNSVSALGWRVDDVSIGTTVTVANTATASSPNAGNSSFSASAATTVASPRRAVADFDGDGDTDRSVYRGGAWYVEGQANVFLGVGGDIPVPRDYDGNGTTDRAVYRNGTWFTDGAPTVSFGLASDIPVPADYDGNGTTDRAVFRPSVGGWYINGQATVFFGLDGDIPVPGDYDGNGTIDLAVFRPSVGGWYTNGQATVFQGISGDVPVPGDYDNNGSTDRAVWRPSVGGWYTNGQATVFQGISGDIPAPGDYDANGSTDRAIWRPGVGGWYVNGQPTVFLGLTGDIPLPLPQAIYRFFF